MNKIEKHAKICMELNELYARKNADYGDSFGKSFKEYGLTMACIRLEDKLNRIKSLTKQAAQVSDESITDTLMDLANYSIMTLVELAQNECETVPEKASVEKRDNHNPACNRECLCMTCVNDNDDTDDGECCFERHGLRCPVCECPNYVKEEECK